MKVGVELSGIAEVRKRLKAFSTKEAKSAVYGALDEVAHSATTKLARRFDRDIEGGPVKFSEVRPGQRRSSVVEGRARRDGSGGVASEIRVQAKQAKYLRFVLGEDDTRTPGEAGFGPKFNMIPVGTAHQIRKFRVEKDKHGNLTRASYRRLYREAFSQRRKDLETLRKRDGRDPTKEEFDAFRGQRKADRKLRRVDARVGTTKKQSIFFGRLGKKKTLGFWNRPPERSQKPTLVVLALQRTRYKREYLVPAWNDSVREAMEELPRTVQRRLSDALARRSG